ncbi:MAG: Methyltransferase SCO0408, partial [uncultured Corynebacteriales bacterium]
DEFRSLGVRAAGGRRLRRLHPLAGQRGAGGGRAGRAGRRRAGAGVRDRHRAAGAAAGRAWHRGGRHRRLGRDGGPAAGQARRRRDPGADRRLRPDPGGGHVRAGAAGLQHGVRAAGPGRPGRLLPERGRPPGPGRPVRGGGVGAGPRRLPGRPIGAAGDGGRGRGAAPDRGAVPGRAVHAGGEDPVDRQRGAAAAGHPPVRLAGRAGPDGPARRSGARTPVGGLVRHAVRRRQHRPHLSLPPARL